MRQSYEVRRGEREDWVVFSLTSFRVVFASASRKECEGVISAAEKNLISPI